MADNPYHRWRLSRKAQVNCVYKGMVLEAQKGNLAVQSMLYVAL